MKINYFWNHEINMIRLKLFEILDLQYQLYIDCKNKEKEEGDEKREINANIQEHS